VLDLLDFQKNAEFHDRLSPQYDACLSGSPANALAREAFQDLVRRYTADGGLVLDFGCGTGLDALEYASTGYHVLAYDNSPGMLSQLRLRCKNEIAAGSVIPSSMDYPAFLRNLPQYPRPDTVAANFAVLNSIGDLRPLFEGFGARMAPGGCLIASLLNPLHWSRVKTHRWWGVVLRRPREPWAHMTEPYLNYLHFIPEVLRAASGFRLVGRANAGSVVRYDAIGQPRERPLFWRIQASGGSIRRRLWNTPAYRVLGHFVFLVLRRDV
jgi:SAM-dependent methyltransferase